MFRLVTQNLVAGLTGAGIAAACAGDGIAWLPASAIRRELSNGELIAIRDPGFPGVELSIVMLQLKTRNMQALSPLASAFADAICETIES